MEAAASVWSVVGAWSASFHMSVRLDEDPEYFICYSKEETREPGVSARWLPISD